MCRGPEICLLSCLGTWCVVPHGPGRASVGNVLFGMSRSSQFWTTSSSLVPSAVFHSKVVGICCVPCSTVSVPRHLKPGPKAREALWRGM